MGGLPMEPNKGHDNAVQTDERRTEKRSLGWDHDRASVAGYIGEMSREMEMIAARHRIEPLRDLLRLAKEEACKVAREA